MSDESVKSTAINQVNNAWKKVINFIKRIFGHKIDMLPEASKELNEEYLSVIDKTKTLTNEDTFECLKELVDLYQITTNGEGKTVASDKKTGYVIEDNKFVLKLRFATIWKKSSIITRSDIDPNEDYSFNDGAKETYEKILEIIQGQLKKTGNIDTAEVLNIIKNMEYRWARAISRKLFRNEIQVNTLTDYFRAITPKIKKQTKKTLTTTVALYGEEVE
ncbi:MAG: hypothetical protein J6B87_01390 [Clostridia bacterium]|nr:hypothetical protein [Clostridia bacterium]